MLNQIHSEGFDATDLEAARREHAAEMGELSPTEEGWLRFCSRVEQLLKIKTLDGDGREDGYSIDGAYDAFQVGWSAQMYADAVTVKRAEMGL